MFGQFAIETRLPCCLLHGCPLGTLVHGVELVFALRKQMFVSVSSTQPTHPGDSDWHAAQQAATVRTP